MMLSAYEQEVLRNSQEGKRANFGFLTGDIESRSIGGRTVRGKGEALNQLQALVEDWNKSHHDKVHVNEGFRTREEQFAIMRKYGRKYDYGEFAKRTGLTMHSTGQAFDISHGNDRVSREFAEFARKRGFVQTVDNDAVHFVYGGGKNAVGSYTSLSFTDNVSQAIRQASGEHGVSENIMRAFAHIESGGRTGLESHTGVKGLFQITGDTWKRVTGGAAYSTDPLAQSRVAARLISGLMKDYGNNLDLVAVAYNAGPTVANRAKKLIAQGIDPDRAIGEATRTAVLDGKLFTDKTIKESFGGSRVEAANKKAIETVNYRKRFAAALGGVDWKADRDYGYQQQIREASTSQDVAGKAPSEREENAADYLLTKKFGLCENALTALASNPEVAGKAVDWLREKGLVNA